MVQWFGSDDAKVGTPGLFPQEVFHNFGVR
jgi:hypothetical protein